MSNLKINHLAILVCTILFFALGFYVVWFSVWGTLDGYG